MQDIESEITSSTRLWHDTWYDATLTTDGAWLKELWPNIKLAMQCLIKMDEGDGLLDGAQHNTLDAAWYGQIAWLSGLYLASLRATA